MQHFPKRMRGMRLLIVNVTVGVVVLAVAAVIAFGAYPQDSVTVYTGCLTAGGTISSLAASPTTPTKPCLATERLIHLSGGTITKVTAGTGLTGGGSDGYVTVGLDPAYSLPQTCTNGQITKSGGPSTAWTCGNQQTYSGSDFALSNQSCSSGQFVTGINSTGHTNCANDQTYSGADFALSNQSCGTGQFTSGVGADGKLACGTPSGAPDVYVAHQGDPGQPPPSGDLRDNGRDIVQLTLPAGSWLLNSKVSILNLDSDQQPGHCSLMNGTTELDHTDFEMEGASTFQIEPDQISVQNLAVVTLNASATITLHCQGTTNFAHWGVLTAMIANPK
jgi:hypothetical protein